MELSEDAAAGLDTGAELVEGVKSRLDSGWDTGVERVGTDLAGVCPRLERGIDAGADSGITVLADDCPRLDRGKDEGVEAGYALAADDPRLDSGKDEVEPLFVDVDVAPLRLHEPSSPPPYILSSPPMIEKRPWSCLPESDLRLTLPSLTETLPQSTT